MREYYITYISGEDGETYIGCGHGINGQEAVRDFLSFSSPVEIIAVRENH